jgi:putative peptidoglycan lipid II flippase
MLSLISIVFNIVLSYALVSSLGAVGLALATSLSTIVYCIFQFYFVKMKLGSSFYQKLIVFYVKITPAICTMSLIMFLYNRVIIFEQMLLNLVIGSAIGLMVYFATLYLIKVQEIHFVLNYALGYIKRNR